jgi:hypothetical protein
MDTATEEKTIIEDQQREDTKKREAEGKAFKPKYFNIVNNDEYEFIGLNK